MPRTSAAVAARTASRVLAVATTLFSTRGFADVSVDDVAQAAGVTRGAVYHHYDSKAGLFRAVAEHLQAGIAAELVAAADASDSPAARLRAGSHAFLDAITRGATSRVLLVDAPAALGWQEWRRIDAERSEVHLRDALGDVLAESGSDSSLLDALTVQLSGAMNDAALWIAQHDDPTIARPLAHAALDRLLDAVTV
ncbi:TetR family transcriptional regulator [Pseudoclavibacter chungangensis]|uniref:TetR family transcriptional regulator n=1 Tax=Pseudoclavibacter chungangensis TaxID=587635 RepID=A0A7J5BQH8_9MICO|nr:TetR/AcrR family transcriptional regulator [Pseudoclavibacter chungangensis]KAB1656288.1 TetR family transcriptional regulator [Pseudoclavibacter chungangensis]NYJ67048.1 AcrR family transcriptional regulator [Pseudoclavibacter chungangensis]